MNTYTGISCWDNVAKKIESYYTNPGGTPIGRKRGFLYCRYGCYVTWHVNVDYSALQL